MDQKYVHRSLSSGLVFILTYEQICELEAFLSFDFGFCFVFSQMCVYCLSNDRIAFHLKKFLISDRGLIRTVSMFRYFRLKRTITKVIQLDAADTRATSDKNVK